MQTNEFQQVTNTLIDDIAETLNVAYDEYAHQASQFNNFNQLGVLLSLPRQKVWSVYFMKHVFGILAYVNGTKEQREPVRQRIIDAIAYLMLLNGMIEEDEQHDVEIANMD